MLAVKNAAGCVSAVPSGLESNDLTEQARAVAGALRIRDLRVEGLSFLAITDLLNEEGAPTVRVRVGRASRPFLGGALHARRTRRGHPRSPAPGGVGIVGRMPPSPRSPRLGPRRRLRKWSLWTLALLLGGDRRRRLGRHLSLDACAGIHRRRAVVRQPAAHPAPRARMDGRPRAGLRPASAGRHHRAPPRFTDADLGHQRNPPLAHAARRARRPRARDQRPR